MHVAQQVLADVPVYLTWGWVSVSVPNLIARGCPEFRGTSVAAR